MDGLHGLLAFIIEALEYADRPGHGDLHGYVYGRNLAQVVLVDLRKHVGPTDLVKELHRRIRKSWNKALLCKSRLAPCDVQPKDILLDQCVRKDLSALEERLCAQHCSKV